MAPHTLTVSRSRPSVLFASTDNYQLRLLVLPKRLWLLHTKKLGSLEKQVLGRERSTSETSNQTLNSVWLLLVCLSVCLRAITMSASLCLCVFVYVFVSVCPSRFFVDAVFLFS